MASPGPGAGASFPATAVGFNYDGTAIGAMPGFNVTAFTTTYGARPAGAAAARPPMRRLLTYRYASQQLQRLPRLFTPFLNLRYGVHVAAGSYGY